MLYREKGLRKINRISRHYMQGNIISFFQRSFLQEQKGASENAVFLRTGRLALYAGGTLFSA